MESLISNLPWICAGIALVAAFVIQKKVMAAPAGNDTMQSLASAIQDGARAFLVTEYKLLSIFVVVAGAGLYVLSPVAPGRARCSIAVCSRRDPSGKAPRIEIDR